MGSVDYPADPVSVALGAGATFVARTLDVNVQHIQEILKRANAHRGTAFVEIYQNCNIFNDGAFAQLTEKDSKADATVEVQHGKPLRFGKNKEKAIVIEGLRPRVVLASDVPESGLYVHDETNELSALILSRLSAPEFPTPIGVFRAVERPSYDQLVNEQVSRAVAKGRGNVQALLDEGAWTID
jgi:2-oxoglutarate ferredoxin oxidoreductase subunit beta